MVFCGPSALPSPNPVSRQQVHLTEYEYEKTKGGAGGYMNWGKEACFLSLCVIE